jgi:imidazolonepropionase-like amidohydrolase
MKATLYRHAAMADGRSADLRVGVSMLVIDDRIAWFGDTADEPAHPAGTRVVDAGGTTIVPSMVDAHSHVSLPGGSHWISRIDDSTEDLLRIAEENGERLVRAGIRWARDVGSPAREIDGRTRALTLHVRDHWHGRRDRPYIRTAGTWLGKVGAIPGADFLDQAADADEMVAIGERHLDQGADHIKLYMDGPDPDTSIWTASEIARLVDMAAGRGVSVTAHATQPAGTKAAVLGGVRSVEHGDHIDADLAAEMAARGTFLVTTHSVFKSWLSFGSTTPLERFVGPDAASLIEQRLENARESTRVAHAAGVAIAGGSDFGGGSVRAGHLAWEVEALVEAGLEPWEALAAVTWRGGELLGEPDAGVLRIDGPADGFLVHGDPLTEPAALWRVVETL